ncbi:MAG TPA: Uma2 family endonuclease [Tepidisphaeraceae bacterium]|nr:Uma2 family endonuclease [Tepidisphaeraceae bacterium]
MNAPTLKAKRTRVLAGDGKPHPGRRMTEREFVEWADDTTLAEWVDGDVIIMPPVSSVHDDLQAWLRGLVQGFADHHDLGRAKGPEFMVRLSRQRTRRMPDVLFVSKSREEIIRANYIEGAPDLIIELVSPESVERDWRDKYLEYERAGVREYVVIDHGHGRLQGYALGEDGKYQPIALDGERLCSRVLPGFYLREKWVLGLQRPTIIAALRELGVK